MKARRVLRAVLLVLIVAAVAIQFVRPDRANPPIDPSRTLQALVEVPADVLAVLDRSCGDCHSHQTRWPWYSHVAPVSWILAEHVREGRSELNFSDWAQYNERRAGKKLEELCEEVREGAMPLPDYLRMHRDARVSQQEVDRVCAWIAEELVRRGYVPEAGGAGPTAEGQAEPDDHGGHSH